MDSGPNNGTGEQSRKRGPVVAVPSHDGFDDSFVNPMSPCSKRTKSSSIPAVQASTPKKNPEEATIMKRSTRMPLVSRENRLWPWTAAEQSPNQSESAVGLHTETIITGVERIPRTTPPRVAREELEDSFDFDYTSFEPVNAASAANNMFDSFDIPSEKVVPAAILDTTVDSFDRTLGPIVYTTEENANMEDSFDNECILVFPPISTTASASALDLSPECTIRGVKQTPPATPRHVVSKELDNSFDSFDCSPTKCLKVTSTANTSVDSFDLEPMKVVPAVDLDTTVDSFDRTLGPIVYTTEVNDNLEDSFDNECILVFPVVPVLTIASVSTLDLNPECSTSGDERIPTKIPQLVVSECMDATFDSFDCEFRSSKEEDEAVTANTSVDSFDLAPMKVFYPSGQATTAVDSFDIVPEKVVPAAVLDTTIDSFDNDYAVFTPSVSVSTTSNDIGENAGSIVDAKSSLSTKTTNDCSFNQQSAVQTSTPKNNPEEATVMKRSSRITLGSGENRGAPLTVTEQSQIKSVSTFGLNTECNISGLERVPPRELDSSFDSFDCDFAPPKPVDEAATANTSLDSFDLTPMKVVDPSENETTPVDSFDISPTKVVPTTVLDTTVDSFDQSFGPIVYTSEVNRKADDSFDNDCAVVTPPVPVSATSNDGVVPGFPSLNDPTTTVLLTVQRVNSDDSGVFDMVCVDADGEEIIVYLQGQWSCSSVDNGVKIRLIGAKKWGEKDWVVDDEQGVLVVDPDTLVPCTAIAGASWCPRKVVLNDRFRSGGVANKAMLIGCIMHQLFQIAVECHDPTVVSYKWLLDNWRSTIYLDVVESLAALNFTPKGFEAELRPYAEVIASWIRSHRAVRGEVFSIAAPICTGSTISEVRDIEENIWEPLLGIKGKIDVTLETLNNGRIQIEPLELKTGKSGQSFEHSGQVLLYNMMLASRYETPIGSGSLLYLKDGVTRPVTPKPLEMKGVIRQRNNLAYHLGNFGGVKLPEPRQDVNFCGNCEQALTCSLYQKNIDTSVQASDQFNAFAHQQTSHLSTADIEYFTRWVRWIYAEWSAALLSQKARTSDLWTVDPDTRESFGQCAASMTLESSTAVKNGTGVLLRFKRDDPIREGFLSAGTMCTVSTGSKYGIVLGYVTESDEYSVTMRSDRLFRLLKLGKTYHLDAYSSFSTYSTTLGNVSVLMMSDAFNTHRRSLIVGLAPPSLVESLVVSALPQKVMRIIAEAHLTPGQQRAVTHSITSTDYSLIEGCPGTGKTTAIVVLVRCLVEMGRSVLITSYTNAAVDNILVKLKKHLPSASLLRLGKYSSVHPELIGFTLPAKLNDDEVPGEDKYLKTRSILKNTNVVACTCHHTSSEVLFSWRKFDVCIVDEASMVLEPVALSALATSYRFVMVGDTKQLAPLVKEKTVRDEGMGISLFERLHVHKHAVMSLVEQFRMNRVICLIASSLFYDGRLVCANDGVAEASLRGLKDYVEPLRPKNIAAGRPNTDSLWYVALSARLKDSCVFVDTRSKELDTYRMEQGAGFGSNKGEATIVTEAVQRFIRGGLSASDIGVMCTYRKQVEIVRSLLMTEDVYGVEVNTVDQYQGREKTVIIWSLAWTVDSLKTCPLLLDERRVNVALTRARRKMVVIGCRSSIARIPHMDNAANRMSVVSVPDNI